MTVEMEQPFVWPEIPDLEPWGQKERRKETQDSARANGALGMNEARDAARKLRDQVKMLLHKEEPLVDEAIEKKKAQGVELSPSEQQKERNRLIRERELEKMSRLKLWEDKRTEEVVQSNDTSRFTIKA